MHAHNPRRPGRTDKRPFLNETEEGAVFLPMEQLETRVYADAMPFPAAAQTFTTMGGPVSVAGGDGGQNGASPLPYAEWDNGHTLMGLSQMWADARFAGFRGTGMRTVVLDSGINLGSPFFGPDNDDNGVADRIVYHYDFANNDSDATDIMGHGSNVASAIASSDPDFGGVAPDADIIALRVFNDAGAGNFAWLERGLQWVIAHAVEYNIASVNLSLGDGGYWTTAASRYNLGSELATLASMGVIVAAAAGNGFYDGDSRVGVSYPASDPNVIAVGAVYGQEGDGFGYGGGAIANTSPAGAVAPFSQRGSLLDIFAPGAPIVGAGIGDGLTLMHGTSQAAPQIAGLALLAQQMATELLGRRLSVDEFRILITSTATTIVDGDDEDDNVTNTGESYPLVNALGMAEAIWGMRIEAAAAANTAPTLDSFEALTGAQAGRGAVIAYETLARAADTSDAEGDLLSFRIESVGSGVMTINGRDAGEGTIVRPGDTVVWTPAADADGTVEAFSIRAYDGVDVSESEAVVSIDVGAATPTGYARGIRLVTDGPVTGGDSEAHAVGLAAATTPELPTVRGLNFLEFTSTARTENGPLRTAGDLFARASIRFAA